MVGDFDAACDSADAIFREMGLGESESRLAVDLGCGHGIHATTLAQRGFRVVGIDTSSHLLAELALQTGRLPIARIQGDLCSFRD